MKIALAQINPTVGDIEGNKNIILQTTEQAKKHHAELIVFPELSITGYPPLDLLDNHTFIRRAVEAVDQLIKHVPKGIGVIFGAPIPNPASSGRKLVNAALLIERDNQVAVVHKSLLPTYDVFDEHRYFQSAQSQKIVEWKNIKMGLHICEDMWNVDLKGSNSLYDVNPIHELGLQKPDFFVNISASPFSKGRHHYRNRLIRHITRRYKTPFVLVNQVGANTEIIFDGSSCVHNANGDICTHAASFREDLVYWHHQSVTPSNFSYREDDIADIHDALVLGIRDYFYKTGVFRKALIGLSGGIDSAVTCALAVEALGADRVLGVTMPSKYSSSGSITDSKLLADRLDVELHTIAINPAVSAFEKILHPLFVDTKTGVAEENIQARTRGVTLMAISNKFGHLLLTTGNKSEMSVGYATLYGDMNGGLAVLADVFKMEVFALAHYINMLAGRDVIPQETIKKPPSAELRPDQKDEDSLPPYPVLDKILQLYIEELLELNAIVARTGYDLALVRHILRLVDLNEYKRRQAPPGLRVSGKAFGIGRRLPIVMKLNRPGLQNTQ